MNRRTMLKSLALGALAAVLPIRPTRAKAEVLTGCDASGLGGNVYQMPCQIAEFYAMPDAFYAKLTDGRCFRWHRSRNPEMEEIPQIPFRMLGFENRRSGVIHLGA